MRERTWWVNFKQDSELKKTKTKRNCFLLFCVSHPEEVAGVEVLLAQVVQEVEPKEEEDVDAHPDHL